MNFKGLSISIALVASLPLIYGPLRADEAPYEKMLFADDESLRDYFADKYGWDPSNISKEDLAEYRSEYCDAFKFYENELKEKKDSKMKEYCTKYLGIDNDSEQEKIAKKNTDKYSYEKKVLDICLESKDFEGCFNSFSSKPSNKVKTIPFNSNEKDFLGWPKLNPNKWSMYENRPENFILYLSRTAKKVKVRGTYGRYISYSRVSRIFLEAKAGLSPQISSSGISSTNCYSYGSYIDCSTTGPTITTIPGSPGRPAGVRQDNSEIVIDCLDLTYQTISKKRGKRRWTPINDRKQILSYSDYFCNKIDTLEASSLNIYAKGEPNDKDRKAIKELTRKVYNE